MKRLRRQNRMIAVGAATVLALLGATGCARGEPASVAAAQSQADSSDLGWAGQALQAVGLDTADLAPAELVDDPAPTATATPSTPSSKVASTKVVSTKAARGPRGNLRHRLVRFAFGKGALHGESVVQTDDGTKTVVAQRGTVTAIDATSVTVKSSDGFTLTWTFGTPITVIERRSQVQPSAIAVGTALGVAGEKSGATPSARLMVVPKK